MSALPDTAPDHRRIAAIAWPIIGANIAQPLLGLVDTAVIGRLGAVTDLGAIALGALIFSFLYWSFGFLRMGTTGFTAQADGAGDSAEVRAALARALLAAGVLGGGLLVLQWPIRLLALGIFDASAAVETVAGDYIAIRIWGAPAALGLFAIFGSLIGLGRTRELLVVQVAMNTLNIVLDVLLAGVLGWGVSGIALGTVLSEWLALGLGGMLVVRGLRARHTDTEPFWPRARIARLADALATLRANTDIMIRTLAMLVCFGWFTNAGARFGDAVLAANHILLQFITFSAYFLDGYAFAAESLVGRAIGQRQRAVFDVAVRRTTHFAVITAILLATGILLAGQGVIHALTDLAPVRAVAVAYLPRTAAYVALSFAAFQLDGVFIAATRTRTMRNASLAAAAVFLVLAYWWSGTAGNTGLWAAFTVYVVARAVALGVDYPRLRRGVGAAT